MLLVCKNNSSIYKFQNIKLGVKGGLGLTYFFKSSYCMLLKFLWVFSFHLGTQISTFINIYYMFMT